MRKHSTNLEYKLIEQQKTQTLSNYTKSQSSSNPNHTSVLTRIFTLPDGSLLVSPSPKSISTLSNFWKRVAYKSCTLIPIGNGVPMWILWHIKRQSFYIQNYAIYEMLLVKTVQWCIDIQQRVFTLFSCCFLVRMEKGN